MSTREQNDLYFGHPGFDQTPTPRPVADDDACAKCCHPRWMHTVDRSVACGHMDWEAKKSCKCKFFVERRF